MNILNLLKKNKKIGNCSAVILCAGSSVRMGADKALLELNGKPVIIHTLVPFEHSDVIKEIIVVTKQDSIQDVSELCNRYGITKVKAVIGGGACRTESALAGVTACDPSASLIAIHDGARPFVTEKIIETVVTAAAEYMAAVPAVSSIDTVKYVDDKGIVIACPDRSHVVSVQTPQVFDADIIKGALSYAVSHNKQLTDDSAAVELMGIKVHTVDGDVCNIKLTVPDDLVKAEAILKSRDGI